MKFLSLVLIILLTSCFRTINTKKDSHSVSLSVHQSFEFDSTFNTIIIQNNKDYPITFRMKFNDIFPLNMSDLEKEIKQISSQNSVSKAHATWKYVSENTFWNKPLTDQNWQHNPLLFLNSIGGGMCDDIASVLAAIWKNTYDSVRVIVLEGHVVSEVKVNEKWKMFDADNGVAYLNSENKICSVKELEQNPSIISNPIRVIGTNPYFIASTPLTNHMADLYASTNNNKDATLWYLDFPQYADTFSLPPYSKMEIVNNGNRINLKIILNKKSIGELKIPLVPYSAKGSFIVNSDNNTDTIDNTSYIFDTGTYKNNLRILEVSEASEINYLINPKLNLWSTLNTIKLTSSDSLKITKTNRYYNDVHLFGEEGLFFDLQTMKYSEYIKTLNKVQIKDLNLTTIQKLFDHFLNANMQLTSLQKKQKMESCVKLYSQISDFSELHYRFKRSYPKSLFSLFIAIKEDQLSYLFQIA